MIYNSITYCLHCREDYWKTTGWLVTRFGEIMSRNRFEQSRMYMHLSHSADPNDKLRKLRPFLDLVNKNFKNNYTPEGVFSIDESMVPYKGRLGFKQYLPMKPVKWGIKLWLLCCSRTGYL